MTSIYDDKQLETSDEVIIKTAERLRLETSALIWEHASNGLHKVEEQLLDYLSPEVAAHVHAYIQIPSSLSISENVQCLQERTFKVDESSLACTRVMLRTEEFKVTVEVTTEWYLDETQLRNLRIQGDIVFQA